ncbi:nuclease [Christiangramia fulva]|uniref:Nuclease n=1 Tax=Christiangramia fulva TaxID=2126553 RepID=A0A2R3Z9W7_9FLAO|nr:thermonuclease family protein [Christiangramia fulva]AVR47060.1 nuclease [Christiangramia fulva]
MNLKLLFIYGLILLSACNRSGKESAEVLDSSLPKTELKGEPKTDSGENKKPEGQISLNAKIIRIVDGDTAELLYDELPIMLRLQHIDAPEKRGKQPYGVKAKAVLSDLCFGQEVTIITEGDFDMGGRMIGVIINKDGLNVNKEMVRRGYAWHFKKYSSDMSYDTLEREARGEKRGLWQDPNPIAPWDFR